MMVCIYWAILFACVSEWEWKARYISIKNTIEPRVNQESLWKQTHLTIAELDGNVNGPEVNPDPETMTVPSTKGANDGRNLEEKNR